MLAELEAQLKERQVVAPVDAEVSVMDLHPIQEPFSPLSNQLQL